MYRSFVTCNDPKGVVTCRTIRKSKAKANANAKAIISCAHKMEDRREIGIRSLKSLRTDFESEEMVMRSSRDEINSPASFQLREVSRGAQKLNSMIECWSKASAFGSQPKDIAKELLKGAIDLQDSLVMLGKLQEASRYMARLKREQQAVEGSGRRTQELKKVIGDGIVKESSAIPDKAVGEVAVVSESVTVSTSDQSACSSQSSSSGSRKGPNLIARLMGLQEYPVTPLRAESKKRVEVEKIREIDKPQSLKEILEGMRSKGVLKNNPSEGVPCNVASDQSDLKQKSIDNVPPIVLIKPVRVPCPEPKETCKSAPEEVEEDPLYRRKMLRKFRRSEEGALKTDKRLQQEKEEAAKANTSIKPKASSPVKHGQKRSKGVEKRADKVHKVTVDNKRNSEEKNGAKSTNAAKCEDQTKRTVIKSRKSGSDQTCVLVKNRNSRRVSAQPSTPDQSTVHQNSCVKKNYAKKEKPLKKATAVTKNITAKSECEQREKSPKIRSESNKCHEVTVHAKSETQPALPENQLCKEDAIAISDSESTINDSVSATETSILEKRIIGSTNTACSDRADSKTLDTEAGLKDFLISSSAFRNRADKLFNLDFITSGMVLDRPASENLGDSNAKLLLDCANELIERKSAQDSRTLRLVLPTCAIKLRQCVSMETLVEEVCGAVEALRDYGRGSGDDLYATLERDLTCGGAMNVMWGPCWKAGFSLDETERVVRDIERLVLSGLIEDLCLNL